MTSLTLRKTEFYVDDAYAYNHGSRVKWLASHLLRYKSLIALFLCCGVMVQVMTSSISYVLGWAFEELSVSTPDAGVVLSYGLAIAAIALGRLIMNLGGSYALQGISACLERNVRDEIFASLLGKSQTFHDRRPVGDTMARASEDVTALGLMLSPGVDLVFLAFLSMIIPTLFVATVHWHLLAAPVLFIVLFTFTGNRFLDKIGPVVGRRMAFFGKLNAVMAESLTGIEMVKASSMEAREQRNFNQVAARFRDFFVSEGLIRARYLPPLIFWLCFSFGFLHAFTLYFQDRLSSGQFVTYLSLLLILRTTVHLSALIVGLIIMGWEGSRRIYDMLVDHTDLDQNPQGYQDEMRGALAFRDVSFSYAEKPILENLSFTLQAGETLAVVGQTGAGKTTLAKLVNRIYDVEQGQILVDDRDVRHWNLEALRRQITTIDQENFLFSRSILDNIALGLGKREPYSEADMDAVVEAAREAQAHDFISAFKDGYHTLIGERGVTLSGGQRQRIAIARMLLTKPRLLVLDDATSATDSATEAKIQKAINRALAHCTTIIITNRLAQIRKADKTLVLERGKIIAQGNHAHLMETCALYKRMFHPQGTQIKRSIQQ